MTKPLPRRRRRGRTLPTPPVAVLGDYPHFLQGMLRKALDRVGIRYRPAVAHGTAVVVFWNPWNRFRWAEVAPPGMRVRMVNATHFDSAKSAADALARCVVRSAHAISDRRRGTRS